MTNKIAPNCEINNLIHTYCLVVYILIRNGLSS